MGQANNVLSFPGVGFGAVMSQARGVSAEMLVAAAQALADSVAPEELQRKQLYPPITRLRVVSARVRRGGGACGREPAAASTPPPPSPRLQVATAVACAAAEHGLSQLAPTPQDWGAYIRERMWVPDEEEAGKALLGGE